MSKKEIDKKLAQEERKIELARREELEKLIEETSKEIKTQIESTSDIIPKRATLFLDYHKVKQTLDTEAKNIVTSIAAFYLDETIIENVPYVKQKTNVDILTISSLLFQMKTSEHAIIKLLGEIDDGNLHPRTFDVLASLQRSKMEIIKHFAQFMIIMENAYKNLHEDYKIKQSENTTFEEEDDATGFRTRGSRNLIQALQRARGNIDDDDVEEIDAEDT